MNASVRQYIFGTIFFAIGVYHLFVKQYVEAPLYMMAGLSFIFNTLAGEPRFAAHKKTLVIVTWVLIILTAIIFLYVLQHKYL